MNGLELIQKGLSVWRQYHGNESLYGLCQRWDGWYVQWTWMGNGSAEPQYTYASATIARQNGTIVSTKINDTSMIAGARAYWHYDSPGHVCSLIGFDGNRALVSNTANTGDTVIALSNHVKISHADTLNLSFAGWSKTDGRNPQITGITLYGQSLAGNQRMTGPNGAFQRVSPDSSSAEKDFLEPNVVGTFNGWIHGEKVEGNDIWFRGANSGYWSWSGGFTDKGTHDLEDLNQSQPAPNQRKAGPNGANQRLEPDDQSTVKSTIGPGVIGTFDGWLNADPVSGNDVWFRGATSGWWSWSGGFTDTGTHDLEDLNEDPPEPVDPDNPRDLEEYDPVLPFAKKGLIAPMGFMDGDFENPMYRTTAGSDQHDVEPIIDRYIIHHTGTTADQLDYFSYVNDRYSCPTWYMRTDGSIFEMIRPEYKPASTGSDWNWRSLATETLDETGSPNWTVTDEQLEAHAQIVAWLAEYDGHELDNVPVSFKIDRTHVISHQEALPGSTACPGPYLQDRLDEIVERAQEIYDEKHPGPDPSRNYYLVPRRLGNRIKRLVDRAFSDPVNYPPSDLPHHDQPGHK